MGARSSHDLPTGPHASRTSLCTYRLIVPITSESLASGLHELWYAREAAWEQFCDTDDEESFPALGQRVASMVNGWFTQFNTREAA